MKYYINHDGIPFKLVEHYSEYWQLYTPYEDEFWWVRSEYMETRMKEITEAEYNEILSLTNLVDNFKGE